MNAILSILFVVFCAVHCQYVVQNVQNTSYIVQTNVLGPAPGPPGFHQQPNYPGYPVRNQTGYQPVYQPIPAAYPIGYFNKHGSHNLFIGNPGYSDVRVFHKTCRMRAGFLQVQSELVKFPAPGFMRTRNITAIRIYDLYNNGNGGYANIIKGGIGYPNVTISLRSQRGHGFNFTIEIFGTQFM